MRVLLVLLPLLLAACASGPYRRALELHRVVVEPSERRMAGGEAWREHLAQRAEFRRMRETLVPDENDDVEVLFAVQVTGSRIESVSITNTQEAGVDEGGLIKFAQGHLVVLRDGWLFVVAIERGAEQQLRLVDRVKLREQPGSDQIWFDELISHGNLLAVLGFDYSSSAGAQSEIRSFTLGEDGRLRPGERIQLRSDDYFSGTGYGMRIRGDELLLRLMRSLDYSDRPNWPEWRSFGVEGGWRPLVERTDVYIPDFVDDDDVLHSYLSCDLHAFSGGRFECRAISVIAGYDAEPYYSDEALYVGFGHPDERRYTDPTLAGKRPWELGPAREGLARTTVVRIPLRSQAPIASVRLRGSLLSGFDFKYIDGTLHVATSWQQQTLLHSLPLEAFSSNSSPFFDAAGSLPETLYYRRFSEQALWVAGNTLRPGQADQARVWMLPLKGGASQAADLSCCTNLMQPVADSMVVLGDMSCWDEQSNVWLRAYGHDMRQRADLLHRNRCLPESRAQAINFATRPDNETILMVWPAAQIVDYEEDRPVAMHFLELAGQSGRETGIVPMDDGPPPVPTEDSDWYGNTRTVIIGERIFLLSGDLMKEVRHTAHGVREVRRLALPREADD